MTAASATTTNAASCAGCAEEREHCHDVLVVHVDGTVECFGGDDCIAVLEVHEWVVDCCDLPGGCECLGERVADVAA